MVAIGVNLAPIKVKTSTWFGFSTSGEGEFDESQVVVINQKSLVIRLNLNPLQVRVAIVFYSMLGIAIFLLLSLLVFKFIKGRLNRKTKKISSTLESSDEE